MEELLDFLLANLYILLRYLSLLTVSILLTLFFLTYLTRFQIESDLLKPNYRGEKIPAAGGLVFVAVLPFTVGFGFLFAVNSYVTVQAVLFLIVILGMGLAGLMDDCFGSHAVKGFKGHLKALLKEGKMTTGCFKAIFGGMIALVFSIANSRLTSFQPNPWLVALDFMLVGLAANIINLFDLRPGRAGKVFLISFCAIFLVSNMNFEKFIGLFLPVLVILLIYLPRDLKSELMLGDVGSNLLGAVLGMMMVWMLSVFGKIIALIICLALQLAAEKVSFSELIEKYGPLRYLDQLGRDQDD